MRFDLRFKVSLLVERGSKGSNEELRVNRVFIYWRILFAFLSCSRVIDGDLKVEYLGVLITKNRFN